MSFLRKILGRGRIRRTRKRLANDPTPRNYAALAQEYARIGATVEVQRVCAEGLAAFPGNAYLLRLSERAARLDREQRLAELKRELAEAPRPAVFQEMSEVLLESGDLDRAEDVVRDWLEQFEDDEAPFALARVHVARFYADRGRDQGREAFESIEEALRQLPSDCRVLRAKLQFLMRIGAFRDAHLVSGRLLQLDPGSPELEGRYRTLSSQADDAPSIEQALLTVQRTGRFVDELDGARSRSASTKKSAVQPILRELAAHRDVHAALYVRGSTVLVQGPKGASAERTARAVHKILTTSRSAGRRLGLGRIFQVQLEGDFGLLAIAPGEADAGAIWTTGQLGRGREDALLGLAGLDADTEVAA